MQSGARKKALLAVAVAMALVTSACGGDSGEGGDSGAGGDSDSPIRLGLSAAMSGPNSFYGTSAVNSIQLAIEEQNEKGGLLGREVELVTYDDQLDPQKAQLNMRRLLAEDEVSMVFSPAGSGPALATVDQAMGTKTLYFTWVAATDEITYPDGVDEPPRKYVFATSIPNSVDAQFMAEAIPEVVDKIGLIGESTPYGQSGLDLIEKYMESDHIVGRESYNQNDTSMVPQLLKLKEAGAQAILPFSLSPDMVTIRKNMETLGMSDIPLVGSQTLGQASYYEVVGELADGSLFDVAKVYGTPGEYTPEAKAFADAYLAAYGNDVVYGKGQDPDPSFGGGASRGAYQAAELYFQAVEEAESLDSDKVVAALESGTVFETVAGDVEFSEDQHYAFLPEDMQLDRIRVAPDGSVTFEPAT